MANNRPTIINILLFRAEYYIYKKTAVLHKLYVTDTRCFLFKSPNSILCTMAHLAHISVRKPCKKQTKNKATTQQRRLDIYFLLSATTTLSRHHYSQQWKAWAASPRRLNTSPATQTHLPQTGSIHGGSCSGSGWPSPSSPRWKGRAWCSGTPRTACPWAQTGLVWWWRWSRSGRKG